MCAYSKSFAGRKRGVVELNLKQTVLEIQNSVSRVQNTQQNFA
jgi:hypothetical protein